MKYYKNSKNQLFANPILANHEDLTEITKEEFEQLVQAINTPTAEQLLEQQLTEKKAYLSSTDWISNKYHDEVTVNGTMSKADFTAKYEAVYTAREEAREFINLNETANNA